MSSTIFPPESIYNLIPKEEERSVVAPRYMSKFREQVKQEKKLTKSCNKTMGPPKVDVPSPEKYLLKHSKEKKLPEKKAFSYGDASQPRKPRVPTQTEAPLMGIHTKKSFVKTNAIGNIMAVPCKPQPAYADTAHGDRHLLEDSGLVPKYIRKKDYGRTPEYLEQRREEVRRAQEQYDNYVKERLKDGAMKQLSKDEHQSILHGLKKNWGELNQQYQGLSVVTDTVSKKQKKAWLESEMKQLEKDIDLMERYQTIYIANT
ncbi:enkurin [Electrophorus electricus]|uniref:Enkurin domain-containing protein n=1 Tax=Electrophorus electricus TaxID=8005 RepID=A0A4W4DRK3_ELEEL|nr:enkurin [Electrophorus electricus]